MAQGAFFLVVLTFDEPGTSGSGLVLDQLTMGHQLLVDLAVMIVDGGEAICDIDVPRHQCELFGPVAGGDLLAGRPEAADVRIIEASSA